MEDKQEKNMNLGKIFIFFLAVVGILIFYNQFQIMQISGSITGKTTNSFKLGEIPKGIPDVYGQELGVSFDNPVQGMNVLNQFDDMSGAEGRGSKRIQLDSQGQDRYMKLGFSIACEFCCGATSLIDNRGQPACACAHSGAMRGLAKYLLENHPEMSDQQILDELTKWKTLFFPKQMMQKAGNANPSNPSVVSNVPEMVGGC